MTISYAFLPAMNKSRHVRLVKICMAVWNVACLSHRCHHCWNGTTTTSLRCIHCLVFTNVQQASTNVNGCHFFLLRRIQWHPPLLHMHFHGRHHSAWSPPLLPSVAWQQNVTEYSWEGSTFTAVTPTFISDVMGQYNKVGGITFRAALVYLISMYICASMKHGSDRCKIFVSVLWAKGRRLSLSKYTMVKECLNTKKHERECWSFHLCTCQ